MYLNVCITKAFAATMATTSTDAATTCKPVALPVRPVGGFGVGADKNYAPANKAHSSPPASQRALHSSPPTRDAAQASGLFDPAPVGLLYARFLSIIVHFTSDFIFHFACVASFVFEAFWILDISGHYAHLFCVARKKSMSHFLFGFYLHNLDICVILFDSFC